jgi:hypothetical protein
VFVKLISLIALFVALDGTTAYATGLISGRQIVNHSMPANKLTAAAVAGPVQKYPRNYRRVEFIFSRVNACHLTPVRFG